MIPKNRPSRQLIRKNQRLEEKAKRNFENLEKQTFLKINFLLKNLLSADKIDEIAKKTNICERSRKLTPLVIASILMIGSYHDVYLNPIPSLERLCLLLKKRFKIIIKPQSLQEKINRPETAKFIKAIAQEVMKYEGNKILGKIFKKQKLNLPLFNRILIEDSTVISLPETLQRIFRGCGGAASKAAVKCNFVIDQCKNQVISIRMVAGRVPDSKLSSDIINFLENDDLVIRDLGYFKLSELVQIKIKNSFFISRLLNFTAVYLNKDDKDWIDLIPYLKKLSSRKKSLDIDVYIGRKERILVRLIAVKVPVEVLEQRRQKYKKKHKKEPSEDYKEWNGYTLMVTNIPKNQLSLRMVLKIYKIRWQIELIFKNIKSNVSIDKITGTNKYRILCFLYIKIIIVWTVLLMYSYGQALTYKNEEASLVKLTLWLKDEGRLINAFMSGDFSELLKELKEDIDFLCMRGKRRRKSSSREIEKAYNDELRAKAA